MHKRTIALAAAALLFNGGAIAQSAHPQKQSRAASNDRRTEDPAKTDETRKRT